jgi:hypothetical protein
VQTRDAPVTGSAAAAPDQQPPSAPDGSEPTSTLQELYTNIAEDAGAAVLDSAAISAEGNGPPFSHHTNLGESAAHMADQNPKDQQVREAC